MPLEKRVRFPPWPHFFGVTVNEVERIERNKQWEVNMGLAFGLSTVKVSRLDGTVVTDPHELRKAMLIYNARFADKN